MARDHSQDNHAFIAHLMDRILRTSVCWYRTVFDVAVAFGGLYQGFWQFDIDGHIKFLQFFLLWTIKAQKGTCSIAPAL